MKPAERLPLAHPIAIAAVATLVLNDHFLKHAYPGIVTGKLSDIAGMIFFPLLLACFHRRGLVLACIATAIVFTLVKTAPWANDLYRVTWGAMQWPFRAAHAWLGHRPTPGLARVVLVRDPSDLVAVPFVLVAYFVARQPDGQPSRQTGSRRFSRMSRKTSMTSVMP